MLIMQADCRLLFFEVCPSELQSGDGPADMAKGKKGGYYLVDWPKMSTFARIIATLFKLYQNRKK